MGKERLGGYSKKKSCKKLGFRGILQITHFDVAVPHGCTTVVCQNKLFEKPLVTDHVMGLGSINVQEKQVKSCKGRFLRRLKWMSKRKRKMIS